MSIQIVNEAIGQYQISTGITRNDLEMLAGNPKTKTIQFSRPLNYNEINLLEELIFSKRNDIQLRIYGHNTDLSYIQKIPSLRKISVDCMIDSKGIETVTKLEKLEGLGVGIFNLESFDFLNDINPNLKELYLFQTTSKKTNIGYINRFRDLEFLYLEGQQKGIDSVSRLSKLQKIVLRSISTQSIDFLANLQELWSVDIKLGGIKNFDALSSLPQLKYLELWQIRDLGDLSFVSNLITLQNLFIQSLKQVQKLPDFTQNKSLRRIYLENLKGLKDLSSLREAPFLKEFIYASAENFKPEDMLPILENKSVESISCGFGSFKRNILFEELASKYNKTKYKYTDFIYL